jgi:hypothetical protein
MTIRKLHWVSGKQLKTIHTKVRSKRGVFRGFDVSFDVCEIMIDSMPPKNSSFWDYHKKWDPFESYYKVDVTYERNIPNE